MDSPCSQKNPLKNVGRPVRGSGCLIIIAVILLLLLLGTVRIYRPRFAASVPERIEVCATQFNGKGDYSAGIMKRNACGSVIAFFEQGTLAMPCMCKQYGTFKIYSEDGTVESIDLLPGHTGPESFQIRMGLWHYELSRSDFGRIIAEAGVDEAKLFAYEALMYPGVVTATKHQAEQAAPSEGDKPPD
jgi:hypothetical protein